MEKLKLQRAREGKGRWKTLIIFFLLLMTSVWLSLLFVISNSRDRRSVPRWLDGPHERQRNPFNDRHDLVSLSETWREVGALAVVQQRGKDIDGEGGKGENDASADWTQDIVVPTPLLDDVGFRYPGRGEQKGGGENRPEMGEIRSIKGTGKATPLARGNAPTGNQTVCIAAVLRGENIRLNEWLNHYIAEGVTHFYLVNTDDLNSTDYSEFRRFIAPYIDAGWVTASHYSMLSFAGITAQYYGRINLQTHAITAIALRAAQREGRHEWILTVDFDEFAYGVGNETVASVLDAQHPSVTQLCVPWVTFYSRNILWQPHCIVPFFTERKYAMAENARTDVTVKCAGRVQVLQQLQNHLHGEYGKLPEDVVMFIRGSGSIWDTTYFGTQKSRSLAPMPRFLVNESNIGDWPIRLNHYMYQSWQFYVKKRSRNKKLSVFQFSNGSAGQELKNQYFEISRKRGAVVETPPERLLKDTALAAKYHWLGLGCVPKKWDSREFADVL